MLASGVPFSNLALNAVDPLGCFALRLADMDVLLIEDALVSQLDPIAIGKPAFAISCGGQAVVEIC